MATRFHPSTTRKLGYERLESRHVYDAGLGIELGPVFDGLVADEFTVTDVDEGIAGATAVGLSDSSHLFVYGQQGQDSTEIFARRTLADGTPGESPQLLLSIPTGVEDQFHFDVVGLDDGEFVLSWQEPGAVRAQVFDSNLDPVSEIVDIAQYDGSISSQPTHSFVDAFQLDNGELAFAYLNPEDFSVALVGRSSDLSTVTGLDWSSEPETNINQNIDELEISQLDDATVQLNWIESDPSLTQSNVQTASFVDNQFTDLDSWVIDAFDSELEIEYLENGNTVVAGVQEQTGELFSVVQTYDQDRNLINTFVADAGLALLAGTDSVITGPDDSYAVLLTDNSGDEPNVAIANFNTDSQLIGVTQQISQTPINQPLGTVTALPNGGYATYWVRFGLDGSSPAIVSRTIRYEQSGLDIGVTSDDPQELANANVLIEGVPADAGLNVGQRTGENVWLIPLEQIEQVRLLTLGERPSLNLTFTLLSDQESALASLGAAIGNDDDNLFSADPGVDRFFGEDGLDRLEIGGLVDDVDLQAVSESAFRLTNDEAMLDFVFDNIEEFQFDDQLLTLQELIDLTSNEGNGGGDSEAGDSSSGENDSDDSDSGENDSGDTGSGDTDSGATDSSDSDSDVNDSNENDSGESGPDDSGSGDTESGDPSSGNTASGENDSEDTGSGDTDSSDSDSDVNDSGDSGPGDSGPGDSGSGDTDSRDSDSGDSGSGNTASGENDSEDTGSGDTDSDDTDSDATDSSDSDSGVSDSGDSESSDTGLGDSGSGEEPVDKGEPTVPENVVVFPPTSENDSALPAGVGSFNTNAIALTTGSGASANQNVSSSTSQPNQTALSQPNESSSADSEQDEDSNIALYAANDSTEDSTSEDSEDESKSQVPLSTKPKLAGAEENADSDADALNPADATKKRLAAENATNNAVATEDSTTGATVVSAAPKLVLIATPAYDEDALFMAMDQAEKEVAEESTQTEIIVGAGIVVATGYSLAQIAWLLRTTALVTNLMQALPIWVSFDPLPLLNRSKRDGSQASSTETLLDIANAKS